MVVPRGTGTISQFRNLGENFKQFSLNFLTLCAELCRALQKEEHLRGRI
jgi:hypothetical protein